VRETLIKTLPTPAHQLTVTAAPLHTLLLLADSALPLGSFAFSNGLESFLAHHRPSPPSASQVPAFHRFLDLSLSTLCTTSLPYVLASYRHPEQILSLDNDFDASTPCTVARRASTAQGRALLSVWDRSFRAHYQSASDSSSHGGIASTGAKKSSAEDGDSSDEDSPLPTAEAAAAAAVQAAITALQTFQSALCNPETDSFASLPANAHLAPLWGLVTRVLQLPLADSAYLFVFAHARTLTSAAVRASVLGPYQAQAVLASGALQAKIRTLIAEHWDRSVEEAGQSVPAMDLWVGRHEKLYSRIFNS